MDVKSDGSDMTDEGPGTRGTLGQALRVSSASGSAWMTDGIFEALIEVSEIIGHNLPPRHFGRSWRIPLFNGVGARVLLHGKSVGTGRVPGPRPYGSVY